MRAGTGPRSNFLHITILLEMGLVKYLSPPPIPFLYKQYTSGLPCGHFSGGILLCFSSHNVHVNHLGILLKCRFWTRWSGVRSDTLHFYLSSDADAAGSRTTLWETRQSLEVWALQSQGKEAHLKSWRIKLKPESACFCFSFFGGWWQGMCAC